ncbi:MAG: hypothetical protein EXS55_03425 [Candidatus Magasanikbacteria bacterium]|nr:hypothetical protein [Candidatus Magasanikbacteria bacterium]
MNEDKVIQKLLDHDGRLNTIEGKIDRVLTSDAFADGQDKVMKILTRLDEERVYTNETIRRIQTEIAEQNRVTSEHERVLDLVKRELHIF